MNPNDPVYPLPVNINAAPGMYSSAPIITGLTKREEFVKAAMMGMLANPECHGHYDVIACDAIEQADALIAELSKEKS